MIASNSMVFLTDDDALLRRGVSRLLRSAGRRLLDLLTQREFEVMQLVVTGMLKIQIAGELGTAEKTIKAHRGRVMKKPGIVPVADLVHLVEIAQIAFHSRCETKV